MYHAQQLAVTFRLSRPRRTGPAAAPASAPSGRHWPGLARMRRLAVMLGLSACVGLGATAQAADGLNDTGVVSCWVGGQIVRDCAGTGQDAAHGRDVTQPRGGDGWRGFRYAKVCHSGERAGQGDCPADPPLGAGSADWGCTLDEVSGLLWELKTDDGGPRDQYRTYTHTGTGRAGDASALVRQVNAVGLCGHQDWRLPQRIELLGLVHYGVKPHAPLIDPDWFPNTLPDRWFREYWSGTRYAGRKSAAWVVSFDDGSVHTDRGAQHPVRLVRGELPLGGPLRFEPKDDAVRDRATGLVWRRCAEGQSWIGERCRGLATLQTWAQALQTAQDAAAGGLPWRLPNVKELATLVDDQRFDPAMDPLAFPDVPTGGASAFWSATHAAGQDDVYFVAFWGGRTQKMWPGAKGAVRLVRDGGRSAPLVP